MKRSTGSYLSAVFVDYDNIYLSLKRKSEDAAKRFAKDAVAWAREIESGRLITPAHFQFTEVERRIVLNRCYGNPVPRRNAQDNSTDMSSFPFVRHHFLRAGFEIVDCPPLTAQLKNSSDIRMVMDVLDLLTHDTHFDEFIILSGDADFTQVLHRLRAHARRTVIFANDYTAAPYTAICDGEVREADLMALLLEGKLPGEIEQAAPPALASANAADSMRKEIAAQVAESVRAAAGAPVPIERLADRAVRAFGHDKTAATNWAGAGSFRELLAHALPADIRLSDQAPFVAYLDTPSSSLPEAITSDSRVEGPARAELPAPAASSTAADLLPEQSRASSKPAQPAPAASVAMPAAAAVAAAPTHEPASDGQSSVQLRSTPTEQPPETAKLAFAIQQSIARIHDACQAPPLAPPEYRVLFEIMAHEINDKGAHGQQTLSNIMSRVQDAGVDVRRDDVRFVFDVVSADDRWFETGASANLFAGRFRNFVVARCRGQGLNLTADELNLIETWFSASSLPALAAPSSGGQERRAGGQPTARALLARAAASESPGERRTGPDDERADRSASAAAPTLATVAAKMTALGASVADSQGIGDELPRMMRTRFRG